VCKHSGWLEVLGCGMVHPAVLFQVGMTSERYIPATLWHGSSADMLRYGVKRFGLFFVDDLRFLRQFQ